MCPPLDLAGRGKRDEARKHVSYRLQGVLYELEEALAEGREAGLGLNLIECLRDIWLGAQDAANMLQGVKH